MKKFFTNNRIHYLFLGLCVITFALLSFVSAMKESLTFDEIVYFQEGRNSLLQHTFDIDPYNPPFVREVASAPYLLIHQYYKNPDYAQTHPLLGRLVIIVMGILLLILCFFTTKKFFGNEAALLTAVLFAFEPNLLAHSHYVTLDIGLTLFFLVSYILFVSIIKKSDWKKLLLLSTAIGVSTASKLSFLPFFLGSVLGITFTFFSKSFFYTLWRAKIKILLVLFGSCMVLWATYFLSFHVVIKERQDANRFSEKLLQYGKTHNNLFLVESITFIKKQPLPLGDFLATMKNNGLRSMQSGQCFFLGEFYSSCQWHFMLVNTFIKIPLPLLIFFVSGLLYIYKKNKKHFLFLVIPLLSIFITVSFLRMQPLVRYVLPAFPFILIFAGASWEFWKKNLVRLLLFSGLILWYISSTLSEFPHFLSFANEFAGYPQERFQLLTDSNLDWGQSLADVSQYRKSHTQQSILFSYFGRDDGNRYFLQSDTSYGSYKASEICAFHTIHGESDKSIILMSSSNWYSCGYDKQSKFQKKKIKGIIGNTILIFAQ